MGAAESSDRRSPDDSRPRRPASAKRSPRSDARHTPTPPDQPAPLENRPPPDWTGPQPEYEDEEPGAYLMELGTRGWNVVWAVLNLAITLWIGIQSRRVEIPAQWRFLAGMAWKMLPLSVGLLVVITLWQKATTYTRNSPGRSRWTLVVSLVTVILWFLLGSGITR